MWGLKIGVALALAMGAAAAITLRWSPAPPPAPVVDAQRFESALKEHGEIRIIPEKKADRLQLDQPKPVETEVVQPPPLPPPPKPPWELQAEETTPPPPPPDHHRQDVCERHHMHKVFTHGGKSWRCRK